MAKQSTPCPDIRQFVRDFEHVRRIVAFRRRVNLRDGRPALGQDQGDVVVLVGWIEAANFFSDSLHGLLARLAPVLAQAVQQAFFPELSVVAIVGFGNSIRVKGEQISRFELVFGGGTFPILEQTENRAGGIEPATRPVRPQHESGEVSAIGVAQAA